MSASPGSVVSAFVSLHRPGNVAELLLRAARRFPRSELTFIPARQEDGTASLSYPSLLEDARRISSGLHAQHRRPGSIVVLLLDAPQDFLPAFWACLLGGYLPCPVLPARNDAQRLANIDRLLERPFVITTHDQLDGPWQTPPVDLLTLRSTTPPVVQEIPHQAKATDPALLVLTSGSTGLPKAVVLTHGNLLASLSGKAECQALTSHDLAMNWVSFDHVAALIEGHLFPLSVGASQLQVRPERILADPLEFLRLIDHHRVTMTFAPNFLFGHLNAALTATPCPAPPSKPTPRLDLASLRHIISGGEAIVVQTGRRFLDLLAPFGLARHALWPAFGMTETCAGCVYSQEFPGRDMGQEFASLGLPVTGLEMRVVDELGATVPEGEPGELQVRGPVVFSHYYNNKEATQAAFTPDGWFRTGDLGRVDDGRLRLVGRSKDSIIVDGVNYFSHELETALEQLDGIERSYVAAFPTRPRGADTERLVVAFAPSCAAQQEDRLYQLTMAIRNTVLLLWGFRPALILPLPTDAFPKTSLGKIQRTLLRHRLEAGELASYEAYIRQLTARQLGLRTPPTGAAESAIAEIYASLFGLDLALIGAQTSFFDLGGTSIDIVRLQQRLEQRFALNGIMADIPLATLLQNPSVRALAARVGGSSRSGSEPAIQPGTGPRVSPTADKYDPIVALQLTGHQTPLFCVHAASGEVLVFVSLANYFVNERPFYALRARGFGPGEQAFTSFDEMVTAYVQGIRRRQPRGPYALAGYSYGAAVAFEIARQLEADGEQVAFLASIDGTPVIGDPGHPLRPADSAARLAFFLSLLDRDQMTGIADTLGAVTGRGEDPVDTLFRLASAQRLRDLNLDRGGFRRWAGLSHSLVSIGESYVPQGTVESATVFYAQPLSGTKESWLNDQLRRWDERTRTPNRYIEVPGEHHTLIGARHVGVFQAALRTEIGRALDGR